MSKLRKNEVIHTKKKEPLEYIQVQINKIRNSVEDSQSQIALQTKWSVQKE